MRKSVRDKLIETLSVIWEGVKSAKATECDTEHATQILRECYVATQVIEDSLRGGLSQKRLEHYCEFVSKMRDCLEDINVLLSQGEYPVKASKNFKELIHDFRKALEEETEVKLEIVFMPYKASMWDSLESVWKAAKEDSRCNAHVIPIPYFDRKPDHSFGQMHYEGDVFPKYVPITHYTEYDLAKEHPDVIYIHNPYDEYNYVTSVHPAFYSGNLKQYTDKLVYVPYFIPGAYESIEVGGGFCRAQGITNADIVVAQSEIHKKMLVGNGKPENQVVIAGNPKLDYVLNHLEDTVIPEEWKVKIGNKKAVLICMSVGSFLNWADSACIELYDKIIDTIIHKYNKAVIYRPHPLLQATIKSMRPDYYAEYQKFLNKYENTEGFVLDTLADSMPAIMASECMFSDYSSLCFSYMVTGKPVGIIVYGYHPEQRENLLYALDYRGCYFVDIGFWLAWKHNKEYANEQLLTDETIILRTMNQKKKVEQINEQCLFDWIMESYISDILIGNDFKHEERMKRLKDSIKNVDGTAGRAIHSYVIKQ